MKVGFVLDNPRRDTYGILFMCYELIKRGHEAYIIPMYMKNYDIPLIGLDALVVNYAREGCIRLFDERAKKGERIYVLDTEGGLISTKNEARTPQGWGGFLKKKGLAKNIRGYFCWGKYLQKGLAEASGLGMERVHATGHPKYDICSEKWREIISPPSSEKNSYILINANFSTVNPKFGTSREYEEEACIKAGYDKTYVKQFFDDIQFGLDGMLNTIKKLANDFPQEQFLLRPHPFEKEEFYVEQFKDLPNVKVECVGEVFDVLQKAKFLLHLNCTTAIEANMLGIVPISLEYLNTELYYTEAPLPSDISLQVNSYEQLADLIRNQDKLEEQYERDELYKIHALEHFGLIDGNSAKRLVDVLEKDFADDNPKRPSEISYSESLKGISEFSLKKITKGLAVNTLGSAGIESLYSKIKKVGQFKRVHQDNLENALLKIKGVDDPLIDFKVAHHSHPITKFPMATYAITKR